MQDHLGGQKELVNGIVHLHQADVRLVVSVMLTALMVTVCIYLFITGSGLSKLFADMLSTILQLLRKKMGYFAYFVT